MMQRAAFVRANTRILAPPLVPEIRLHLAEQSLPIWRRTEEELGAINLAPPFWAFAWAGGQALARWVLDNPTAIAGRSVLDLGAGSGLVGIAAGMAGAGRVLCADIDAFALAAMTLNGQLNGITVEPISTDLLSGPPPTAVDLICLGDLFYDRQLAEQALAFCHAGAANGAVVLAGDPGRSYFPTGMFDQIATYSVAVTRELEDSDVKQTPVWLLKGLTS